MKRLKLSIIFLLITMSISVQAQIGGANVYEFILLSPSARLISLGGINVSTIDDDVNFGAMNPALVNEKMHQHVSFSFSGYLEGIQYGYAGYSQKIGKIGDFHTGVQYLNSGQQQGADEFGNFTQTFSSNELMWVIGASRSYKRYRYGVNLKIISDNLAPGYHSWGGALDLGASYYSKNELFSAGLVVRNMGTQFTTYTSTGGRESLPFEVVLGVSNKLKYMPLRFSITATHLEHPNLIYDDPDAVPQIGLDGEEIKPPNQTADRIFRHFVFGAEFLLGKGFRLRGGYNHMRRQELRSVNRGGLTGFSLGAGIRISRFAFDYGYTSYGAGSVFDTHQVSLSFNFAKPEAEEVKTE